MKFNLTFKATMPLMAAIMLSTPSVTSAQTVLTKSDKGHGQELKVENPQESRWQMMTPTMRDSLRKTAREKYPMMFRKLPQAADPSEKIVTGANKGVAKGTAEAREGVLKEWNAGASSRVSSRAPLKADANDVANSKLTWYGYIPSSTGMSAGVYKFTIGPNPKAELVSAYTSNEYGFGSAIIDGKMYLMRIDKTTWSYGWVNGNFSTVDLSSGKFSYYGGLAYADYYNYCGYATAQASDGTVYGQFFNSQYDATNLVWGSRDYSSMTKIADFGASSKIISVALGITSDGKLYSIGEDGNLYQVSTTDGKETLVGPTGVTPYSVNGTLSPSSGEIDPKTNTFYWAAVASDGKAGLYTVDLKTGQATKISDWSSIGNVQVQGLTAVTPPAEDGAPAIATNLSLSFEGGNTTGLFNFTAPETTYAGDELKDSLDFEVRSGTDILASGKVLAGDEKSVTITAPEGQNTISVTTSNSVGKSPIAKISQWIGYDVPAYPTGVTASVEEETGIVTVKWTAPTRVYHSGYKGDFTYNIYHRTGSNASSDTLIGTSDTAQFKFQLPAGKIQAYKFSVETVNGTQKSTSRGYTSTYVAWGSEPMTLPYEENFKDDKTFAFFKVINNNGDNNTWKRSGGWAASNYSYNKDQDKWLITPLVHLTAGHDYVLSYSAACNYSWYKDVKYRVKYGKFDTLKRTAEGLDKLISDTITLDSIKDSAPIFYNDTIHVDETGNYAVGFHYVTRLGVNCGVKIGPISITKVPLTTTPDSVRNLTVTPASNGDYRAQIIFQAPQYDISGNKLTENITWIALLRNGTEIYRFRDVVPGSYIQYSDEGEDIKVGNNTYSIVCYLTDEDYSPTASASAYIGVDIPQAVPSAAVVDNVADKTLDFTWNKVSSVGSRGHKVKVNEVEYGIYSLAKSYFGGYYRDQLKGYTYDLNLSVDYDTQIGDPGLQIWSVAAANEAGISDNYILSFVTGAPKQLPYEEHFPNGAPSIYTYFTHTIDGTYGSYGYDQISSDGDGKCIDVFAYADSVTHQPVVSAITSSKFDLTSAEHPTLVYDVNEAVANGGGTHIAGIVEAGPVITELAPQAVNIKLDNDFKRYKVSLDNYKDRTNVSFGIGGRFNNKNKYAWIDYDNVHLLDLRATNMGIRSITPQAGVKAGNTANIDFVVENVGENEATGYVVKAEADGKVFYTDTISEALPMFGQKEFTVSLPTSIYDKSHDIALKVSVAIDGDEIAANDTATSTMPLVASPYPVPENVAGEQQGKNVAVTWKAPATDEAMITEDFDDMSIFKPYDVGGVSDSTLVGKLGDWTVENVDKTTTTGPGVNIPYNLTVKSFQVINTDTLGAGAEAYFPTRSGAQTLVSFAAKTGTTDHWLISPELTGSEQTISLYYRQLDNTYGNDAFQILASNGSVVTDSFTLVKSVSVQDKAYQQVKADLPEGSKYFAVRHTYGTYGLQLDDITFTVGSGIPVGYNIYVDGKLFRSLSAADITKASDGTMTFVNTNAADGEVHEYAVSAVFIGGESRPVPVSIETTGISTLTLAPGEAVDIYTIDGRIVRRQATDFSGMHTGVYVVKGQKVMIK